MKRFQIELMLAVLADIAHLGHTGVEMLQDPVASRTAWQPSEGTSTSMLHT